MRTILTVATVWFATILLAPVAIAARVLGLDEEEYGIAQWCMRTWARSMCRAAGVKVVVHNPERIVPEGAVYACNHVSWFDVFAIASVLPRYTFIAKQELRKLPIFGYGAEAAGVVFLARDFSLLVAAFLDADHLRVEEISPASASRRPSRLRAGTETVSLPLGAAEGTVPQSLKVHFAYFSGPIAWRPIVVSVALLALGNLMGAFMFAQQISRFFGRRFHVEKTERRREDRSALPSAA